MHQKAIQSCLKKLFATVVCLYLSDCFVGEGHSQDLPKASGQPNTRQATKVYPLDGLMDKSGAVWIVDRNKPGVWLFQENQLKLEVQGSNRFRQPLNAARCLAISPAGDLAIGDPATREVYRKDSSGQWKATLNGIVGIPVDLAFLSDGTLLIADLERRVLWKQTTPGSDPEILAGVNPRGVFVDHADRIWVVSQDEQQLLKISKSGEVEPVVSKRVFDFPHQVVVNTQDQVWVTDGYRKGVWSWKLGEEPKLAVSGDPLQNPVGLFLVDDQPAIVDPHAQSVFKWIDGRVEKWFSIEDK